jgi:hypothetical protein
MKKITFKRILCLATTIIMLCVSTHALEPIMLEPTDDLSILRYATIRSFTTALTIDKNGTAECSTKVQATSSSYTVNITMHLQQKDSSWETIKTWDTAEILNANLTETWYVISGYDYRIYVTASIVNSTGKELETATKYSNIVSY